MLVCPNEGIAVPMPDLLSLFNRLFAFGNMAFARQNASGIMPVVPLAPQLGHDPRVPEKRTACRRCRQVPRHLRRRAAPQAER